jgi:nitrate/nitrite transporter NarK
VCGGCLDLRTAAAEKFLLATAGKEHPRVMLAIYALFAFSGIGNGSTYKMIPAVSLAKAEGAIAAGGDPDAAQENARRLAGTVIGIAAPAGARHGETARLRGRHGEPGVARK